MSIKKPEGNQIIECLGTKPIHLPGGYNAKEALLAVFHVTSGESQHLRVAITDGNSVYQREIAMSDVKMKVLLDSQESSKQKAVKFAKYFLKDNNTDKVQVIFDWQEGGTGGDKVIEATVKYPTDPNNEDSIRKMAWKGILTTNRDLLSFFHTLGTSINRGQYLLGEKQQGIESLQGERQSWKEATEKLEGTWQSEKDTLLHNFCKLYNRTRAEKSKAQDEVKALQQQLAECQQALTEARRSARSKRKHGDDSSIPDQPDDYDNNLFPPDMVDALAEGRRVDLRTTTSKRKIQRPKKETTRRPTAKRPPKGDISSDDDNVSPKAHKKKKTAKVKAEPEASYDSDDSVRRKIRAQLLGMGNGNHDDSSSDDERSPKRYIL